MGFADKKETRQEAKERRAKEKQDLKYYFKTVVQILTRATLMFIPISLSVIALRDPIQMVFSS